MRREHQYLQDIVDAADTIASFVAGIDREQFIGDALVRSAVVYQLLIMGEAAAHVQDDIRERYPGIMWRRIVGFRNFAAHTYFAFDWELVWDTATVDAPEIRPQILELLRVEFGGSPDS
ncbi:MAG: hypothetical protein QOF51_1601 [Chloroflexota bacterium]|jgi:uncharacterized protein with HEPN domain|nr:hypothetical protein [Chloroflexota bacterium]